MYKKQISQEFGGLRSQQNISKQFNLNSISNQNILDLNKSRSTGIDNNETEQNTENSENNFGKYSIDTNFDATKFFSSENILDDISLRKEIVEINPLLCCFRHCNEYSKKSSRR